MSWSSKPQAQVWQTKSFASAIRGAAASGPPPGLGPGPNGLPSLHSVQQQPKPTEILNLTHNHFQQKLSQANISSHVSHFVIFRLNFVGQKSQGIVPYHSF